MKLPQPPSRYDAPFQQQLHHLLELADDDNRKKGRDIEVHPARLILRSPNGTRYEIKVSNAGVLSAVPTAPGAL